MAFSDTMWDLGSTYLGGYTAPKQSGDSFDWVNAAKLGLAAYQTFREPKTKNVPLSPEERQLYNLYFSSLMNPSLKNNASDVNMRNKQVLDGYKDLKWESPKTFSGQTGYSGSSTPITPYNAPPPVTTGIQAGKGMGFGGGQGGARLGGSILMDDVEGLGGNVGTLMGGPRMPTGARYDKDGKLVTPADQRNVGNPTQTLFNNMPNNMRDPASNPMGDVGGGQAPSLQQLTEFLSSQGVKDAGKVAIGFLTGGLPGAAMSAIMLAWQRYLAGGKR